MDSLPIELYRCIFEVTERRDLLRLVVVNRTFQVEIERLLHHKVILGDSIKWIVIGCRRLLALPRFHPLVHRLCIFQFSSDPKAVRFLSCRTILASLLEKLTNLVSLTTRILPEEVIWRKCGTLFRNCTFQLRILRCPFALDADFASFLESQNSLSELEWCPHTPPIRHLSRTALPNLRILACHSDFFEELAPELLTGRPITHIASNFGKPPIPKDLPLSTAPIRALKLPWPDIGMLKSIPEHCPQLELLAFVDLDTVDEEEFLSQVLHRLKNLHTIEIGLEEDEEENHLRTVSKLQTACPTLRQVRVDCLGTDFLYSWNQRKMRWECKQMARLADLWQESVTMYQSRSQPL